MGVGAFDSGREMGAGLAAVRGGLCALFMGGGPEEAGTGTGEDVREIGAGGGGGGLGCEG